METKHDLLMEIGTEELPPKALWPLAATLQREVEARLHGAGLSFDRSRPYATPRRLALEVQGLAARQSPRIVERTGPAVARAFDSEGKPTPAALGFARSCGVSPAELERKQDGGVERLHFRAETEGEKAAALIPKIIEEALAALPIPKRMRWGSSREEFVRPVHWLLLLLGGEVLPAHILGVESGNLTRGHRFHHPEPISLNSAAEYEGKLKKAFVIADFAKRREEILRQVKKEAKRLKAESLFAADPPAEMTEARRGASQAAADPLPETAEGQPAGWGEDAQPIGEADLATEVAALVEWPVALVGSFDPAYLEVPREALVSAMTKHQRCFCLLDQQQNLLPKFIVISNLASRDPQVVIAGNEKVIGPRLADAAFFYAQDKKTSLASRHDRLRGVIFQEQLGTLHDKSARVAQLAEFIAPQLGLDPRKCAHAAHLGKCDLLTDMVNEFPELQGIMGYYYALHDGEEESIALALREQYLPRHAGDRLPSGDIGMALALAERLDAIVGLFGIRQPPTGSKDPYGLRRAAMGILRICLEEKLELDLAPCVAKAIEQFAEQEKAANEQAFASAPPEPAPDARGKNKGPASEPKNATDFTDRDGAEGKELADQVLDFIFEREGLRTWLAAFHVDGAVFQAVDAVRPTILHDFQLRAAALAGFANSEESRNEVQALAAANKRVARILAKADQDIPHRIDEKLLLEEAETALTQKLESVWERVIPLIKRRDYQPALAAMASLRPDIDRFFDDVMVNVEDDGLRRNRLALLHRVRRLFLEIADISFLQQDAG